MNENLMKILKQITDKKNEVKSLVASGKLEDAKRAKKELEELDESFQILYDLEDKEKEKIIDGMGTGEVKPITDKLEEKAADKKGVIRAFVNVVAAGLLGKMPKESDLKVYNAAFTETATGQGLSSEFGITVPQDLHTEIEELRRSEDNLEQYVNVEPVSTLSGSRPIEVEADSTPFDTVDEASEFPDLDEPHFRTIKYAVKKMGGILKVSKELLEDTAENVWGYIKKWIAKKTKATRNGLILKRLDEITKGKEISVADMDGFKDIFNVSLDPAIAQSSICITNQSGFNFMDKLKDNDGNYIMQPDPTKKTEKLLFGVYPVIKLSNKTLKSEVVDGTPEGGKTYKYPVYCGDLKEAITIFDRKALSFEMNDKGAGLWEKDLIGAKVRDRLDVVAIDEDAVVKAKLTEIVEG